MLLQANLVSRQKYKKFFFFFPISLNTKIISNLSTEIQRK